MMFMPALIAVGVYFNRRRALATGIATSGSGLGTFTYAYLTNFLLSKYGWNGTVLILAGILLNCVVSGLFFRPLVINKAKDRLKIATGNGAIDPSKLCHGCQTPSSSSESSEASDSMLYTDGNPTLLKIATGNGVIDPSSSVPNNLHKDDEQNNNFKHYLMIDCHEVTDRQYSSAVQLAQDERKIFSARLLNPMLRKDIFYSGSIQNLPECQKAPDLASVVASLTRVDNEYEISSGCLHGSSCCVGNKKLFNTKLMYDKVFLLLLVCMTMWTGGLPPLVCLFTFLVV